MGCESYLMLQFVSKSTKRYIYQKPKLRLRGNMRIGHFERSCCKAVAQILAMHEEDIQSRNALAKHLDKKDLNI